MTNAYNKNSADNDNAPVAAATGGGLRFLSVCSGIEAASVAWHPLGWRAVAFSEIEPAPCSVLKHHYPDVPNLGDMTKFKEWPDYGKDGTDPIQLVCGGTPCQAFSVAGLREGLNDPRGNLSLTFLAIVDKYRPKWVLFENVPGILSSATHIGPDSCEPTVGLDGDNGPGDGEEVVVEDEYDADESHAFSCFLAGLSELGYGAAYRVIDAQYVRVDGFAGAVPQRRRRVFVVGYLGDWRRAAAVLLEPESMSGHPAPSRKAGQKSAPTLSARTQGGGGLGTDFELDGGLIPQGFGGGNQAGSNVDAACLTSRGQRIDFEVETFIADVAPTMRAGGNKTGGDRPPGTDVDTLESLVAETPYTLAIRGRDGEPDLEWRQDGTANAVLTPNGGRAGIGVGAIAFAQNTRDEVRLFGGDGQTVGALAAEPGMKQQSYVAHAIQAGALRENPSSGPDGVGVQADIAYTLEARAEVQAVQQDWAVRRLTPVECARLQGFPDDYLSQVLHNGKPLADGPMYKGLGNSWPVNSVRWIGRRIQLVEEIARELDAANDNHKKSEAA